MNRHVSRDHIKMANKDMKSCSKLLVIEELESETTV